MPPAKPHKVVIGNWRFRDFAGSEITTLELAEEFRYRGSEVAIASSEFGGQVTALAQAANFRLIDLVTEKLDGEMFDLAWLHHSPTYYALVADCKAIARNVIFSSLSHFEPLESPPIPLGLIDAFLVNSAKNLDFSLSHYPTMNPAPIVFPNTAPRQFWSSHRRSKRGGLKSIALVSNHPPDEVYEAVTLLRRQAVSVDIIGANGKSVRVTPALIDQYDCIITIGKTVQYCLARLVPVFCYDHFGGPGWITTDNIFSAGQKNFSGRCTPHTRPPKALVEQLLGRPCKTSETQTGRRKSLNL